MLIAPAFVSHLIDFFDLIAAYFSANFVFSNGCEVPLSSRHVPFVQIITDSSTFPLSAFFSFVSDQFILMTCATQLAQLYSRSPHFCHIFWPFVESSVLVWLLCGSWSVKHLKVFLPHFKDGVPDYFIDQFLVDIFSETLIHLREVIVDYFQFVNPFFALYGSEFLCVF